jgi:hypothetical protein
MPECAVKCLGRRKILGLQTKLSSQWFRRLRCLRALKILPPGPVETGMALLRFCLWQTPDRERPTNPPGEQDEVPRQIARNGGMMARYFGALVSLGKLDPELKIVQLSVLVPQRFSRADRQASKQRVLL